MDRDSEVRGVREAMSETAGHDIRKLISTIDLRRAKVASRVIDPGTMHTAPPMMQFQSSQPRLNPDGR